jgi:putative thioredoxin
MMSSDFIIDVNDADFEYEVVAYSQNIPVIVDFWATWCKPCKVMDPILERLVIEAQGAFRLARVDVDQNPTLAMRFSVRNIPTIKAFSGGVVVSEFVGAQPEARLREFVAKITPPSPLSLALEKAESLLKGHQWSEGEKTYRSILEQEPGNPSALLGLSKIILGQGKASEAVQILHNFPASRQYNDAEVLMPYADALMAYQNNKMDDTTDRDVAFRNSIRLASRGNFPAALDGLFDILRQDKKFRNGKARLVALSLFEIMGEDDPNIRQYRSELASILF